MIPALVIRFSSPLSSAFSFPTILLFKSVKAPTQSRKPLVKSNIPFNKSCNKLHWYLKTTFTLISSPYFHILFSSSLLLLEFSLRDHQVLRTISNFLHVYNSFFFKCYIWYSVWFLNTNARQTLTVMKQRNRDITYNYFYVILFTVTLLFSPTISYSLRVQTLLYSASNK